MEIFKNICSFIAVLLSLYSLLIVIRILLSWIVNFSKMNNWRNGYGNYYPYNNNPKSSNGIENIANTIGKITDPYLNLFRNITSLRRSPLDFTPVIALIVLNILQSLFSMIAKTGKLSVGILLAIAIDGLWSSLFAYLFIFLLILLIARYFIGRSNSYQAQNWINAIDPILDSPVKRVYKIFFNKKANVNDQKLILVSFFFYLIIFVSLRFAVRWLVEFLVSI